MNMGTILSKSFRAFLRDKRATLTIFLSPIAFMMILGFIIAGISGGTKTVTVRIAVLLSKKYEPFEVMVKRESKKAGFDLITVDSVRELKNIVAVGKAQMGIVLTSSSLLFVYNQSFGQYNNYLTLLEKFLYHSLRKTISGIPTYIGTEAVSVKKGVSVTVISFILPGALAIAITTSCVLSLALALSTYRSDGSLKLLKVTPISGPIFIFSTAFHRFWSSILSAVLTLLASEWIFSNVYEVNWSLFFTVISTSVLLSLGIGALFSTIFRDIWTTMNFSTVSLTVMMLFSNVFYPFSIMPSYMRFIARLMPITYFTAALRYALGISPMYFGEFVKINVLFVFVGIFLLYTSGKIIFSLERR